MMEKMLRDPNMQKMLYPYLPEPMRNPESIEWMLNNPEVRKQMEGVFAQSVSASTAHPHPRPAHSAASSSQHIGHPGVWSIALPPTLPACIVSPPTL